MRSGRAGAIRCMPLLSVAMTTVAGIHLSSSQLQGARQLAVGDVLSVSFTLCSVHRLKAATDDLPRTSLSPQIIIRSLMGPVSAEIINLCHVFTLILTWTYEIRS